MVGPSHIQGACVQQWSYASHLCHARSCTIATKRLGTKSKSCFCVCVHVPCIVASLCPSACWYCRIERSYSLNICNRVLVHSGHLLQTATATTTALSIHFFNHPPEGEKGAGRGERRLPIPYAIAFASLCTQLGNLLHSDFCFMVASCALHLQCLTSCDGGHTDTMLGVTRTPHA